MIALYFQNNIFTMDINHQENIGGNYDPKHYFCHTRCPGFDFCGTEHEGCGGKFPGLDCFNAKSPDDIWDPGYRHCRRLVSKLSQRPKRDQTQSVIAQYYGGLIMREDREGRKIVKGGFRATLALLISIVAIILAFIAYNRTGNQAELNAKIKSLQTKMETMKNETSQRLSKVREETSKALKKMGVDIKKEE
jgi:hypothetical protein